MTVDLQSNAERLGYRRIENGVACEACGIEFFVRPKDFAVGGDVLRSHRRRCPVSPAAVPTPGVCDA